MAKKNQQCSGGSQCDAAWHTPCTQKKGLDPNCNGEGWCPHGEAHPTQERTQEVHWRHGGHSSHPWAEPNWAKIDENCKRYAHPAEAGLETSDRHRSAPKTEAQTQRATAKIDWTCWYVALVFAASGWGRERIRCSWNRWAYGDGVEIV